jgi:diguanylate cyclase (GGDEF)-like protein/PAS domain S-box-containing protein
VSEQSLINLLVVDHERDNVDHIVQTLQTAGHVVQVYHATQEEEIRNYIDYKPLDLIMVRLGEDLPTAPQVHTWVTQAANDIPLIALLDDEKHQNPAEILRNGADNVGYLTEPDHLVVAVDKEIAHLKLRKQVRSQEIRLQESEQRSRNLLDSAGDGIAYLHEGAHIYANPAYLKLFGFADESEIEGVALMDLVIPPHHDKLKRFLRSSIRSGKVEQSLELTGMDRKKRPFPIKMDCQPTRVNDEPCLQIVIHNSAEQQNYQKQIRELTKRDTLTGLYNRKFFTEHLNKIQSGETPTGGGLLYILITEQRKIANQLGLEAADQLLSDLGQRLQQLVPSQTLVGHLFDAVFAVYLAETSKENALELGQQIREAINTHVSHAAQQLVSTTACIGICLIHDRRDNATQILSNADQACENARQKGGDGIELYRPPDSRSSLVRQEDEHLLVLRDAISEERMELAYQAIASFQGNPLERYKLHLRLLDEERSPLSLDVLGQVAESFGLMQQLDKWAILHSLKDLTAYNNQQDNKSATLFMRISANSVTDIDFCDWLERRLRDENLPGKALVIEITETCAEKFFKEAQVLRNKLQDMACGFAVSHFGGRPHSERIMIHLKPDYIKLDMALIEQLAEAEGDDDDDNARSALTKLAEKAQEMDILVVAADVSTAFQMASIWQFGVSLVYGNMVQEATPKMAFDFQQFAG